MTTRKIPKEDWSRYFEQLTERLRGHRVELDLLGVEIGDQVVASHASLESFSFDERAQSLEVSFDHFRHLISNPHEVWVEEEVAGVHSLFVLDGDNHQQILKFSEPPALP
jgi:hypothetical protein